MFLVDTDALLVVVVYVDSAACTRLYAQLCACLLRESVKTGLNWNEILILYVEIIIRDETPCVCAFLTAWQIEAAVSCYKCEEQLSCAIVLDRIS